MIKFFFILPIVFITNTYSASKKIPLKTNPTLAPSLINYSKTDKRIGRRLYDVFKQLKKYSTKTTELNLLRKDLKKSEIFSDLIPFANFHRKIIRVDGPISFKKNCMGKFIYAENSNFLLRYNQLMKNFCRNKLLTLFNNEKTVRKNFALINDYLRDNLSFFLTSRSNFQFNAFLKIATRNKKQKTILSDMFFEHYNNTQIKPKFSHIKMLEINSNFNTLLNKKNITHKNDNKYFRKFVRKKIREIKRETKKPNYKIKNKVDELIKFTKRNVEFLNKRKTKNRFISLALTIYSEDNFKSYVKLLEAAKELTPENRAHDVNFYILLNSLVKNDFKKSLSLIKKYQYDRKFDSINNSKLQYWMAKTVEENGDRKKAIKMYSKIIKNHPLSYYSIVSLQHLNRINQKKLVSKLLDNYESNHSQFSLDSSSYKSKFIHNFKRLHVWLDLNLERFISLEFQDLIKQKQISIYKKRSIASSFSTEEKNQQILFLLLSSFFKKKKHLFSFRLIFKELESKRINISSNLLNFLFPIEYWKTIKFRSKNIDPVLILSLIRQESAFNPLARSHVGAEGLMQLMLPTARQYGKRLKRYHLKKPKTNIKIGVKYLKRLIRKFDNNLIFTLAAYNAGETIVRRWRRKIDFSKNPIMAIEQIPYKETRNYVKLIYRNIFFYKLLRKEKFLNHSLSESFRVSSIKRQKQTLETIN